MRLAGDGLIRPTWAGRRACRRLAGLRVGLALWMAAAGMAWATPPDATIAQRAMEARNDAGADPQRALLALRALRERAVAARDVDGRLAVDEAECRVLTDFDSARAAAVAEAGLEGAAPDTRSEPGVPWRRLRACHAGMLLEQGQVDAGREALESLLALPVSAGAEAAHAIALLERGVHLSRSGEWDAAQQDLLAACEQIKRHGPPRDHDLCLGHLANHYKRVADADEALRLLQALNAAARRRGAIYDVSIYSFGIGQVQQELRQPEASIASFDEAAAASRRLDDTLGVAYADHAAAVSLLALDRAPEALERVGRAIALLDPAGDPRQHENQILTRAETLARLGRTDEAAAALAMIEAAVRQRNAQPVLMHWHEVRAEVMRQRGQWREAYAALTEVRTIGERLQQQRLSLQSARLRMQFNRARDAEELVALQQANAQGQRLRRTQAVALVLLAALLLIAGAVMLGKVRQARGLRELASTDELTRLSNRRSLLAFAAGAVEAAQRHGAPLSLLMIDIDHFKRINDAHGHATGDLVLRHVARLLGTGLREGDRLGRLGGEEFATVLQRVPLDRALRVAERMRAAVAASPLAGPGGAVRVTVSIGVAELRSGEPLAALLQRADDALYRAKHGGRNAVAADDGIHSADPVDSHHEARSDRAEAQRYAA